jgi:phage recombination protein Bet
MEDQNVPAVVKPASVPTLKTSGLNKEQVALLKRTIAKNVSDDELALFMHVANRTGLDPFAKQIHAVRRWNSDMGGYAMTIQTGIDGYRLLADRTGKYSPGKDTIYGYDQQGNLEFATSYIMKKVGETWFEVSATARYSEYVVKNKEGIANKNWLEKPHIMLAKCAEALALRKAFPAELSAVYIEEELGTSHLESDEKPKGSTNTLSAGELKYFHTQITKTGIPKDIIKKKIFTDYGKESSKDLTREEANQIVVWAESHLGAK